MPDSDHPEGFEIRLCHGKNLEAGDCAVGTRQDTYARHGRG